MDIEKTIRQYKLSKIIDVDYQDSFDILDDLYDKLKATHSTKDTNDFDYNLYFFNEDKLLFAIRPSDAFMWFCSDYTNFNIYNGYGDSLKKYVFAVIMELYNVEVSQINRDFSSNEIEGFGDLHQKY